MGEQVEQQTFTREHRTRYRKKVRACLDVFERMLVESKFDFDRPATGLERSEVNRNGIDGCAVLHGHRKCVPSTE